MPSGFPREHAVLMEHQHARIGLLRFQISLTARIPRMLLTGQDYRSSGEGETWGIARFEAYTKTTANLAKFQTAGTWAACEVFFSRPQSFTSKSSPMSSFG